MLFNLTAHACIPLAGLSSFVRGTKCVEVLAIFCLSADLPSPSYGTARRTERQKQHPIGISVVLLHLHILFATCFCQLLDKCCKRKQFSSQALPQSR